MYDLVAIGSAVKDIIIITNRGKIFKTPKNKLEPEWLGFELGEKIRASEAYQNIGGVAIDISLGLNKLGFKSRPFSTIGEDTEGHWLTKELKRAKIKINGIMTDKNRLTPFSVILIDKKSGERVIFTQKSSGDLNLASLFKFKTRYLYVSSLKGKIKEQTETILDYLSKNKSELIISPSTSQIRDDFPDLEKILRIAGILILNRNEALEIASKIRLKKADIKSLIATLRGLGPEIVCVTDGAKGAYVGNSEKILYCPIIKVGTVDMTGAGDAFASGFLGFLLKGKSIEDSLRAGIVNSASVVQFSGTTKGLLSKKDILKKITKLRVKRI
jgi:sugar/nucleoside kinase (ribokinase family)